MFDISSCRLSVPYLYLRSNKMTAAIDYLLYESSKFRFAAIKHYLPPVFAASESNLGQLEMLSVLPTVNLVFWHDVYQIYRSLEQSEDTDSITPTVALSNVVPTAPLHLIHVLSSAANPRDWHQNVSTLFKLGKNMSVPPILRMLMSLSPVMTYQKILIPLFSGGGPSRNPPPTMEKPLLKNNEESEPSTPTDLNSLYTSICDFVNQYTHELSRRRQSLIKELKESNTAESIRWLSDTDSGACMVDVSIIHLFHFLLSATVAAEINDIELTTAQVESILQFLISDVSREFTMIDNAIQSISQPYGVFHDANFLGVMSTYDELQALEKRLGFELLRNSQISDLKLKEALIVRILRNCTDRLGSSRPLWLTSAGDSSTATFYLEAALSRKMYQAAAFIADVQSQVDKALDILLAASEKVEDPVDLSQGQIDRTLDGCSSSPCPAIQYIFHVMASFRALGACISEYFPNRTYSLDEWDTLSKSILRSLSAIFALINSKIRSQFVGEFLEVSEHVLSRQLQESVSELSMDLDIRTEAERRFHQSLMETVTVVFDRLFLDDGQLAIQLFLNLRSFTSPGIQTIAPHIKRDFFPQFLSSCQKTVSTALTVKTLIEEATSSTLKAIESTIIPGTLPSITAALLNQDFQNATHYLSQGFESGFREVQLGLSSMTTTGTRAATQVRLEEIELILENEWPFDQAVTEALAPSLKTMLTEQLSAEVSTSLLKGICHLVCLCVGPATLQLCSDFCAGIFTEVSLAVDRVVTKNYQCQNAMSMMLFIHEQLIGLYINAKLSYHERNCWMQRTVAKLSKLQLQATSMFTKKLGLRILARMEQVCQLQRNLLREVLLSRRVGSNPKYVSRNRLLASIDFSADPLPVEEIGERRCIRLASSECVVCKRNVMKPVSGERASGWSGAERVKSINLALSEIEFDGRRLRHRLCAQI
eukprot:Gregarina_sp_Poly_1__3443@NODE_19_length_21533_cov_161_091167_g17_i0_p2_GENE_NODE_19_length_21533_cov_161_091167_g17_i0NODE_19_length_21533_cov_161_091167_g17_i0_p2_ORF_typecomplete_len937_score132_09_NODE_19_length_21533_cov_161_091167_g17_i022275037